MEFQPLDEELEDYLRPLVASARPDGSATIGCFESPEYRELKRLGYFADTSEYMDCTASVTLSYAAIKYFDRKEKWEADRRAGVASGIGGKLADVGGSVLGAAASKFLGL